MADESPSCFQVKLVTDFLRLSRAGQTPQNEIENILSFNRSLRASNSTKHKRDNIDIKHPVTGKDISGELTGKIQDNQESIPYRNVNHPKASDGTRYLIGCNGNDVSRDTYKPALHIQNHFLSIIESDKLGVSTTNDKLEQSFMIKIKKKR